MSEFKDIYEGYPVKTYGKLTCRDYQQASVDEIIKHLKSSAMPGVASASVGAGKTIIIAALCKHVSDLNGKVLVISRQGEIVSQDAEDCWLAECMNSTYSASLGIKSAVYPVIMGSEGTVCRSLEQDRAYKDGIKKSPSKLYDFKADLILIDECHHVDYETPDSQYMKIIKEMQKRNPKLRIIGLTGTPFRGVKPIVGDNDDYFWKKQIVDISTKYLTNRGFLTPCSFGFADNETKYDLDEFKSDGEDGAGDFSLAEMRAMEKKILSSGTTTQKIMLDIVEKAKNRNVVMITCAGKKHCKEAASALPSGTYAIITDDVGGKKRRELLDKTKKGEIKYIFQCGVLTTGYNNPLIDTMVILRKIGSLTLLVQLIGRGLRLLKDEHKKAGIVKKECLVLDFSDTLRELGGLYENPILEQAEKEHAKKDGQLITCPKCGEENSQFARRCIGFTGSGRCDFFWKSRTCDDVVKPDGAIVKRGCGAENDIAARECRCCENTLIDPNDRLKNTHYTDGDDLPVVRFSMRETKNDGLITEYTLQNGKIVTEFFMNPKKGGRNAQIFKAKVLVPHAKGNKAIWSLYKSCKNIHDIISMANAMQTVKAIMWREGNKTINRRISIVD